MRSLAALARFGALVACCSLGCGRLGYELAVTTEADAGAQDAPPVGGSGIEATGGAAGASGGGGEAGSAAAGSSLAGAPAAGADAGGADAAGAGGAPPSGGVGGIGFDPCAELPALAADPVIDGVIDGGLVPVPVTPRRWDGLSPLPPDASASLAVAWRPSGLYFFAAIGDGSRLPDPDVTRLYCGDAVELYVDSNGAFAKPATYDAQGTRQFIIAAPVDATTPRATGEVYRMTAALGSWTSKSFRAFPTADGYVVEAFVTAQDLGLAAWSLTAGARVAIDFAHDLSQTSAGAGSACVATRLGQSFLAVIEPGVGNSTDLPYQNPEAFCRPTLRAP